MIDETFTAEFLLTELNRLRIRLDGIAEHVRNNPKDLKYNKQLTKWFLNLQHPPKHEIIVWILQFIVEKPTKWMTVNAVIHDLNIKASLDMRKNVWGVIVSVTGLIFTIMIDIVNACALYAAGFGIAFAVMLGWDIMRDEKINP